MPVHALPLLGRADGSGAAEYGVELLGECDWIIRETSQIAGEHHGVRPKLFGQPNSTLVGRLPG
jgi:hypothetical protein